MDPISPISQLRLAASSVVDEAVRALRQAMLDGSLRPGTALREQALSDNLGVSRNTVREALRVLGRDGLVQHIVNRGAVVAQMSMQGLSDIYDARIYLECSAVERLLMPGEGDHGTDPAPNFELMTEAIRGMGSVTAEDPARIFEFDSLFHSQLVSVLRNPRILHFYSGLQAELRLAANIADQLTADPGDMAAEHHKLLGLILHGNAEAARAGVVEHLRSGLRQLAQPLLSALNDHVI